MTGPDPVDGTPDSSPCSSSRGAPLDPSVDTGGEREGAECPYCGSTETVRDHPKGPSLCRSMHYCRDCEQPFETFG